VVVGVAVTAVEGEQSIWVTSSPGSGGDVLRRGGAAAAQQFNRCAGSLRLEHEPGFGRWLMRIRPRHVGSRQAKLVGGEGAGALEQMVAVAVGSARSGLGCPVRLAPPLVLYLSWARGAQPTRLRVWLCRPVPFIYRTNGQDATLGPHSSGGTDKSTAPTLAHSRCHHVHHDGVPALMPLSPAP